MYKNGLKYFLKKEMLKNNNYYVKLVKLILLKIIINILVCMFKLFGFILFSVLYGIKFWWGGIEGCR